MSSGKLHGHISSQGTGKYTVRPWQECHAGMGGESKLLIDYFVAPGMTWKGIYYLKTHLKETVYNRNPRPRETMSIKHGPEF